MRARRALHVATQPLLCSSSTRVVARAAHTSTGWNFAPFADGHCTVRVADLEDGLTFYEPAALQQLGDELRRVAGRGKHTMANSAVAIINVDDPLSAADWVGEPSSGEQLRDGRLWRNIYELSTFQRPTVALVHPGAPAAGPALLASIIVAKKNAMVGAAVPAHSEQGPVRAPGQSFLQQL